MFVLYADYGGAFPTASTHYLSRNLDILPNGRIVRMAAAMASRSPVHFEGFADPPPRHDLIFSKLHGPHTGFVLFERDDALLTGESEYVHLKVKNLGNSGLLLGGHRADNADCYEEWNYYEEEKYQQPINDECGHNPLDRRPRLKRPVIVPNCPQKDPNEREQERQN